MPLKERICVKLNVRSGTEVLDKVLIDHLDHTNVRSAAAYLVPGHHAYIPSADADAVDLPRDELLILYSVDGMLLPTGDAEVFILDRTTLERHRQHASARKPIHYVALQGSASLKPADHSKVSNEIPPAGEHALGAGANGADWGERSAVRMISFDANPSTATMVSTQSNAIITRSSHALAEAIAAAEAAERGVANVDYETAMTHCCGWLAETMEMAEEQFKASEAAADTTLGICEAFLHRNTVLQKTREYISADPNVFTNLERALHTTSAARQRWAQKKAALDCLAESTRLCATWMAMLSSYAMSLRIRNPASTQSLDATNATMASIADALVIILSTFPGQSAVESDQFTHYVQQRVVPQMTADLTSQVEKLLNLQQAFSVGPNSIPATPSCTTTGYQSHLISASWALRSWCFSWAQTCAAIGKAFPARLGDAALSAAQAAAYASERIEDLRDVLLKTNRASLGIMNTEVAVLYTTIHRAANAFPLLRSSEVDNWERFMAAFNKTLALRLTNVEAVEYEAPRPTTTASPVAPFSPLLSQVSVNQSLTQTTLANHNRSLVNASMLTNTSLSMAVEEREVLSSRVTVLTHELAEARLLIASLQGQLQRANASLAAAQELNVYMMAEARHNKLGDTVPAPSGRRESLIERLAREEHSRLEAGRQIEDEELDS